MCIKLVIWKSLYYDAWSEKHQIKWFILPKCVVLASFHKNGNWQLYKCIRNFATIGSITDLCGGGVKKSRPHTILWMLFTEIAHVITVTKYFPTCMLLKHFEFFVTVHGTLALHYYHSKKSEYVVSWNNNETTFLSIM